MSGNPHTYLMAMLYTCRGKLFPWTRGHMAPCNSMWPSEQKPAMYMWPSEQKPAMFAYKVNSFYCPSYLNNYACSLPPLANINWSAYQDCFFNHVNPLLVTWCQWSAPIWQWGPDIACTVSMHLSRPCSGILAFMGECASRSHSKLCHCVILLLCLSLCHHLPHLCGLPTHLLIYTGQILIKSMKMSKLAKINYYLLARLVVQNLIDN